MSFKNRLQNEITANLNLYNFNRVWWNRVGGNYLTILFFYNSKSDWYLNLLYIDLLYKKKSITFNWIIIKPELTSYL